MSAIGGLPDIAHGQAIDSVVGDALSADATNLQVPAAEVGLGWFKTFERTRFRWIEDVSWCDLISVISVGLSWNLFHTFFNINVFR